MRFVRTFAQQVSPQEPSQCRRHQARVQRGQAIPGQIVGQRTNNGTYVNSKGEIVKGPENCSTAPQGATARCRDGSIAFAKAGGVPARTMAGLSKWL